MTKLIKVTSLLHLLDTFNNTNRYLADIFSLNNPELSRYTTGINPKELTLNKSDLNISTCPFLDLNISISKGKVHTQINDKRNDFLFAIVNFPFWDGDVSLAPSYGVYLSQLIRYTRVCSDVIYFNPRNLCITGKLIRQGFRYYKLLNLFTESFQRYKDLSSTCGFTCRTLIKNGISHHKFYGNIVLKARESLNRTFKQTY